MDMNHVQDTRGRTEAIGSAAAVTLATTVDAPAPVETDSDPEAGGEQDIPTDREGVWSNPGSVRG
jgi:hypothetical protein